MKEFEYRHTVSFEETNLVGNVYFTNYLLWQGKCREFFIKEHAPDVIDELSKDLALVTVRVSCEFYDELFAFDEVILSMKKGFIRQNRVSMNFDYWKVSQDNKILVARGEQEIACMKRVVNGLEATSIPISFGAAIESFN